MSVIWQFFVCRESFLCADLFDRIFRGVDLIFSSWNFCSPELFSYFLEIRWIWLGHTLLSWIIVGSWFWLVGVGKVGLTEIHPSPAPRFKLGRAGGSAVSTVWCCIWTIIFDVFRSRMPPVWGFPRRWRGGSTRRWLRCWHGGAAAPLSWSRLWPSGGRSVFSDVRPLRSGTS